MRTGDWSVERQAFRGALDSPEAPPWQRRPIIRAEKPKLQVKTTETGHIACHLIITH